MLINSVFEEDNSTLQKVKDKVKIVCADYVSNIRMTGKITFSMWLIFSIITKQKCPYKFKVSVEIAKNRRDFLQFTLYAIKRACFLWIVSGHRNAVYDNGVTQSLD